MKTALVVIAKMEDQYIDEWLAYNRKLGFDKIFIYENDWRCNANHEWLMKIPFDGAFMQKPAFTHWLKNYQYDYNWVAFFDVDEFLVLKKHAMIQDFLTEYDNPNGIAINLQTYGADGKMDRNGHENSILKQFTKRQRGISPYVKLILKIPTRGIMIDPHQFGILVMDTNRKYFSGPWNVNGPSDIAVINHYARKCFQDWLIRCRRGYPFSKDRKSEPEEWDSIKNNDSDVEDLTALKFMYGLHW